MLNLLCLVLSYGGNLSAEGDRHHCETRVDVRKYIVCLQLDEQAVRARESSGPGAWEPVAHDGCERRPDCFFMMYQRALRRGMCHVAGSGVAKSARRGMELVKAGRSSYTNSGSKAVGLPICLI